MECTRHFVATVYVVHDGATALHHHEGLDMWLPPGGHVDRDELPHEAALRETYEETGLDVELVADPDDVEGPGARSLPRPRHLMLEDINVHGGEVGHQHVDHVYFGRADERTIDPAGDDEVGPERWDWFAADDLAADGRVASETAELGRRAIASVE